MTTLTTTEDRRKTLGSSTVPRFARVLPLLLLGFVFLDRGFAWLHVPGTPLYVTEIVLALGVTWMIRGLTNRWAWGRSSAVAVLVGFMAWGLLRTVPWIFEDAEVAFRDGVTWIYAVVAFAVVALQARRPDILGDWLAGYRKVILVMVVWLPSAVFLAETLEGLHVPDSDVSLFSYKPGNASVHLVIAIGFLWAVWSPRGGTQRRRRYLLTALAVISILFLSTQGRGGFVAAAVAGALLVWLVGSERTNLIRAVAGSLLAIALAVVVVDPQIDLGGRDVSADQLAENVASIVTGEGEGELGGNVQWRLEHWGRVWEGVNEEVPLAGHGFGSNIAALYEIPQEEIGLRNAHNSHLTILARMGWVGGVIWLLLWAFWYGELARARGRFRQMGHPTLAGVSAWTMVAVTAIHVNAIFDPTLEGPQVGVWLWALCGLGIHLTVLARAARAEIAARDGSLERALRV